MTEKIKKRVVLNDSLDGARRLKINQSNRVLTSSLEGGDKLKPKAPSETTNTQKKKEK